jgi:hypothetical protein
VMGFSVNVPAQVRTYAIGTARLLSSALFL